MNKIAAYELLLDNHPLWTKEAGLPAPEPTKIVPTSKIVPTAAAQYGRLAGGALGAGALYLGYKALTGKKK